MAGAAPAAAQSTAWTGGGGDSMWSTVGNWSNGVPTAGVATNISSGSPSVVLGGGLTASSGISKVGSGSTLIISSGASLTSARWDVGQFGDGSMVVTGTGTELIVNADGVVRLLVGNGATGALTITDGAVVNVGNAGTASVAILGNNSGSGSILLSAVGSNRGVLEVFGINRQAGSLTFDGGILRATGDNNNFLSTFSSGSVVINSGGGFIDSNGFNISISAPLTGSGGLTKLGAETLSLTTANSYTGVTTISAGYINVSNNAALGSTGAGTVVEVGGALQLQNDVTISEALTLNGTGPTALGALRSISGTNTYAGDITLGSATLITHSSGIGSLTVSGSVSGSFDLTVGGIGTVFISGDITTGTGGLTKEGNSTLVLSGTGNTFTGATTINAGILQAGALDVIASSSALVLANVAGAVFTTGGYDQSVRNLSGGGSTGGTVIATTGTTLTIIQDGGGSTFSGNIGGGGNLAKTGADVLILSGTNSYSGTTSINSGELRLGSAGALAGTSMVTLANSAGAVLSLNGFSVTINGLQGGGSTGGQVDLGTGTLTVSQTTNTTFSGEITGAGSLVKAGTGTLTLSGASDFTGGLVVTGGLVNFNSSGALGSSSGGVMLNGGGLQWATGTSTDVSSRLSLGAFGGTLDTNGNNVTLGTIFGGTGGLTKLGSGTLTLTAAATYAGSTIIGSGTLSLIGTGSIAASSGVTANGVFDISGTTFGASIVSLSGTGSVALGAQTLTVTNGSGTFSGTIGGTGGLTVAGGIQALSGVNGFTGETRIEGGTLALAGGGSVAASSGVVVNGTFDISSVSSGGTSVQTLSGVGSVVLGTNVLTLTAQAGDFQGDISGTGGLALTGPGTLVLTGASSYSGGTNVTTGALVLGTSTAAGTGAIAMSDGTALGLVDTLSVANNLSLGGAVTIGLASGSATLSGILSGTGIVTFGGGGRISLTGDSSAFTGSTLVSGTLAVNGRLGGSLTVENGGTLKGSGTVGSATVASGGTMAPGNSIGTLTVNGTLTFVSGSTYTVEIDTIGASDLILVTGTATLGGAAVAVTKAPGVYLPGTRYTILTAQSGIIGTFSGLSQDLPFVDLLLFYDTQNAYLEVARNVTPLPSVAVTANQRATAAAVQALGEGNAVYNAVVSQASVASAQQAFNTLDGEIYPTALSVLQQESLILRRAVLDRARVPAGGPASAPLAYAAGSVAGADVVGTADSPNAFWAQAFGAWGRIDGTGNAATVSGDTAGVIVGYDRTFVSPGADWRLGFAAGYSSSGYQVDARSASFSSDNAHVALYGGTRVGALGARVGGAFSWADISASRMLAFPGFLNALKADTSARTGQVFAEVGYGLSFAKTQVEPFAGLAYVNVDMSGFTELGGPSALTGSGSSAGVTYSTLGVRFSVPISLADLPAAFNGTLAWQHAFGDTSPETQFAFTTGALPFSVSGVPIASDAALVEAGLDLTVVPNGALSVFYAGQLSQSDTSNMVKGKFALRF